MQLDASEVGHAPAAAFLHDVLPRLERVLRGAEEGILAPRHRGRARVVGLADEYQPVAPDADDALDKADGDACGVEVRSLLDVQLDIGGQGLRIALGLRRLEGVIAGAGHGIDEAFAVDGRHAGDRRGIELADEGPGAEEAAVAAFLVAPRRHGERQPGGVAGFPDRLQALEAGEHPEGAVQRTTLRDGVDVRARHHGGPAAAQPAECVAGRIHPGLEPCRLHPSDQPRARFFVRRAPSTSG